MTVGKRGAAAKGAQGEKDVEALFVAAGFRQAQRAKAGREDDRGDIAGVPELTVEVKTQDDLAAAISEGLRELVKEQANNGTDWGVVFAKRRMKGFIAVMDGAEYARLYARLHGKGGNDGASGT